MSSKQTKQRAQARASLHEARARDLRAIHERIIAIFDVDIPEEYRSDPEKRILELAENAVKQDDQRLAPARIARGLRELRDAVKRAEREEREDGDG